MAVELTKIMADGGIDYLLKTVANDHPTGAMDYYTHPGNKPGVWLGRGCEQMGVTAGETASKEQVTRLYSQLRDPNTGKTLDNQSQGRNVSSNSVSGFDLTFTMPKSVSVLWAVGDDETRRQVMECFYESIDQTMEWWQDNIAMTRVGRGGIAQMKVKGITAARFDHWDTREHDPHLHSHVVVSNIVQRADGGWAALDGSVVYRGHIECSERQQNLLFDLLHERMGIDFEEREDLSKGTKAVVMDAVGVPADLIDRFSTRSMQTDRILSKLVAERKTEKKTDKLSFREMSELKEQAFQQARKAKDEYVPSLNELVSKWTSQVQELGYDPKQIVADTVGHEPESFNGVALAECAELQDKLEWLLKGDLIDYANGKDIRQDLSQYADRFIEEASQETRKAVKSNATTISRFQIEAAAERLTRRVRCDSDTRQAFTDAVVDRVVSGLVPLTPHRYQLDGRMRNDPRIDDGKGYAVMDNSRNDLYATPELIKAEHYLFDMMDRKQENWSPDREQVRGLVDQYSRNMEVEEGHGMAGDQSEAAVELLAGNDMIMALTGPAGTGKTTTMRAVKQTYDRLAGQGKVIGMATSAKAAGGLGESLQIPTSTVAKIINDNLGGGKERRDRNIGRLEGMAEHDGGLSPSDKRRLAELYADRASNEIPQDGIVILDEASMTSTRDLETIARLCEARNARLIMTGDPYQLDAPGEGGGFLGYMERHDRVLKLTSVWRFLKRTVDGNGETRTEVNHAEVEAGLALRTGMTDPDAHGGMPGARRMLGTRLYEQLPDQDGSLVVNRNEAGRIHGGSEGSMEDKVFNLTLDALTEGRNSLLIVATNNDLSSINERITTSLQARGKVDADPNHRTALRGRLTAGKGDVVCTRKVDRTNKDQKGEFVRNGDLWTVEEVGEDGRMLLSRRDDPAATVTVSAQYARESCELGYAVTAHRSQGMTVDYGNLWVPEGGSVSSELLYVALTRGRYCNDVWIDTPDMQTLKDSYVYNHWRDVNRAEFERTHTAYGEADLEPTPLQLAEDKFNTMAANSQAPLTASETREHHAAETKGVKRLVNERDLLSDMIMEPRLYHQIEHAYGEETASLMRQDGRWERLLNTYTRAMAVDSTQVGEIVSTHAVAMNGMRRSDGKLFELPDAATLAKELNDSLHERIVAPARGRDLGWRHGLVPIPQDDVNEGDGNVRRLLEQNGTMLDEAFDRKDGERLGQLTGPNAPKWMERMPAQPSPDDPEELEGWRRLVLDVDAYRSGMGVTANYPLGPLPRKDEAGMAWRRNLSKRIGEAMAAAGPGDGFPEPSGSAEAETGEPETWGAKRRNVIVDIRPENDKAADMADKVNRIALDHWRSMAEGTWVESYAREHGLDASKVAWAPAFEPASEALLSLARSNDVPSFQLRRAGLVDMDRHGRYVDRFRDRMMLPIQDGRGRIIAFTGLRGPDAEDGMSPEWLTTPSTDAFSESRALYGDGKESRMRLRGTARSAWCGDPLDVEAVARAGMLLDPDGGLGDAIVPLAPCGAGPSMQQFEMVRREQGGKLARPIFCFDADERGRSMTAAAWGMLQPGERMTACGLILPDGVGSPGEMAGQGRFEELAECLRTPRPLHECLTDSLADGADFSTKDGQAAFLRQAGRDVVGLLPDGMKERAALYVDDTLERKADEIGVEDRLHVALPEMGVEASTAGPGLG